MRRRTNVVKFPKPNERSGVESQLTLEQLIIARDAFKLVSKRMLADYEADIAARQHPSVVHLRPRPIPNNGGAPAA
jgi:hypothetical protein